MAEPNWDLWEQILWTLQTEFASMRRELSEFKADTSQALARLEEEVSGLTITARYAVGTETHA